MTAQELRAIRAINNLIGLAGIDELQKRTHKLLKDYVCLMTLANDTCNAHNQTLYFISRLIEEFDSITEEESEEESEDMSDDMI